jgi:hypothetical protein
MAAPLPDKLPRWAQLTTWAATTWYAVGDRAVNDAPQKIYECTTQGTSAGAGGPTGSGGVIADGSVVWTFIANLAAAAWLSSHAYSVGARVTNGGNLYVCTTAGTSAGAGGPTTTDPDITDGTVHWMFVSSAMALVVEPPESMKDIGWIRGQKPPATYFNWILWKSWQWLRYLQDLGDQALTFTAGITITQSSSDVGALDVTGNGNGMGLNATGGSNAVGVVGNGGGNSKQGVAGTGAGPNGTGVTGDGVGVGTGVIGTGGDGGGVGVRAFGQGGAAGVLASGSGSSAGVNATGGATNGAGVIGHGGSSNGPGGDFTGGPSSPGVKATGGSSSGAGVEATGGVTNGYGVVAVGSGGGAGIKTTGGSVGPAIEAYAFGTTDYPIAVFYDKAGTPNLRTLFDHNGYLMGRWTEWREGWRPTETLSATGASNVLFDFAASINGTGSTLNGGPTAADIGARYWTATNSTTAPGDDTFWYSTPIIDPGTYVSLSMEFEACIGALGAGGSVYIGLTDGAAGDLSVGTHNAYLMFTSGDASWSGYVSNGGGNSGKLSMGTAATIGGAPLTFVRCRIEIHGSGSPFGSMVRFYMNGANLQTYTTHVPAAALKFAMGVKRSGGAANTATINVGPVRMAWNLRLSSDIL